MKHFYYSFRKPGADMSGLNWYFPLLKCSMFKAMGKVFEQ